VYQPTHYNTTTLISDNCAPLSVNSFKKVGNNGSKNIEAEVEMNDLNETKVVYRTSRWLVLLLSICITIT